MTPIVLVVTGRVTRDAVPGLCAELEALLHGPDGAAHAPDAGVDCDVGGVVRADLVLVEAIARLVLVARRAGGRRLRLRNASPELRSLLDLVGLAELMGVTSVTGVANTTGVTDVAGGTDPG
ncbi:MULTISPECIES: STAS domain-containing protein [unclassified Streptomyces]|uniref:STAS domain-containing protein n=1 Tax=unclassified Streptomyces TaxID=2593676 RepID=UPI0011E63943|nr:STAS domain-containing protein [Streptomyces sp. sk2.1]TXS66936.1 STAS domain-containing protein [Streptomyces sp. sk2.1]